MPKIKVYPVHENAHVLTHPADGRISDEGSNWEDDAFTARLIDTNEVTTDEARAHKFSDDKKMDQSRPPAHATNISTAATGGAAQPSTSVELPARSKKS